MSQPNLQDIDRVLASYFGPLKQSVEDNKIDLSKLPPPQVTVPEIKLPVINIPEIKVPEITVPPVVIPPIHVPKPEVTVNVDRVKVENWPEIPPVDLTPIIKELKKLQNKTSGGGGANSTTWFYGTKYVDVSSSTPLPVTLTAGSVNVGDIQINDQTGSPLDASYGGVYALKVAVTADSDKYVRGNVAEGIAVSDPVYVGFRDGSGLLYGMRGDATNGLDVDVTRSALPTGASTLSEQQTQSTSLSSLLTELRVMNGGMAMQVDDTSGTLYQGWAEPGSATAGALWRIRRVVSSGTPEDTSITFADGNRNFDNVWDNRASLTYS